MVLAVIVLFAFSLRKVIASGLVNFNIFLPTVVPPKLPKAVSGVSKLLLHCLLFVNAALLPSITLASPVPVSATEAVPKPKEVLASVLFSTVIPSPSVIFINLVPLPSAIANKALPVAVRAVNPVPPNDSGIVGILAVSNVPSFILLAFKLGILAASNVPLIVLLSKLNALFVIV